MLLATSAYALLIGGVDPLLVGHQAVADAAGSRMERGEEARDERRGRQETRGILTKIRRVERGARNTQVYIVLAGAAYSV